MNEPSSSNLMCTHCASTVLWLCFKYRFNLPLIHALSPINCTLTVLRRVSVSLCGFDCFDCALTVRWLCDLAVLRLRVSVYRLCFLNFAYYQSIFISLLFRTDRRALTDNALRSSDSTTTAWQRIEEWRLDDRRLTTHWGAATLLSISTALRCCTLHAPTIQLYFFNAYIAYSHFLSSIHYFVWTKGNENMQYTHWRSTIE